MAKHALQPVNSSYNKIKMIIPLITAGALLSCTAAIAQADTGQHNLQATASVATQQDTTASTDITQVAEVTPEVIAPIAAKLSFDRPAVTSTAAPKPAPAPVAPEVAKETTPAPTAAPDAAPAPAAPAATPTAVAQVATASPANPANIPAAAGVAATTSGTGATDAFGEAIVKSALSQLNVEQDCTRLVSNSLKAVGINFHDWPAGYLSLGSVTTNPQPGDLIYYKNGSGPGSMAHIAVFIGNYGGKSGMAVHGGWDGHTTKVFSANVGSGPIYIHVNR